MKLYWTPLLGLLVACAGGDAYTREGQDRLFGRRGNFVWARGPWPAIQPSRDLDEVIDQLCPAIMQLPRASDGDYGQEYCGALYSLGDGTYYATYATPLGPTVLVGARKRKQCEPPRLVVDERGRPAPVADYHSHPWAPSQMSSDDLRAALQLFSIRVQVDTACNMMKLIPYLNESRPGEAYIRRGKKWVLVGYIQNEDKRTGRITAVDDD
jgi:proteasome lid subunit RPN8/RPN11